MKFSTTTVTTLFLTTLVSLSTTEARIGQTHALAAHRRLDEEEEALGDSNAVTKDQHLIDGYTCGSNQGATNTNVYYPNICLSKACPLVLFERGSGGWNINDNYDPWLKAIAEQELIVIAPTTSANNATTDPTAVTLCKHDKDLRIAYDWATLNPLHLKAKVDFDHIGVAGHSAGGKHIPTFIYDNKDISGNIKVALLSHGAKDITNTTKKDSMKDIPSMFTTSAGDTRVLPNDVKSWFDTLPYDKYGPNIFVNLASGCHGEPHGDNSFDRDPDYCVDKSSKTYQLSHHTGYFLACHLNGKYCDKAYNEKLCEGSAECIYTQNWTPTTDTVAAIDDNDADADVATDVDVATDAATDGDADAAIAAADADGADAGADTYN